MHASNLSIRQSNDTFVRAYSLACLFSHSTHLSSEQHVSHYCSYPAPEVANDHGVRLINTKHPVYQSTEPIQASSKHA